MLSENLSMILYLACASLCFFGIFIHPLFYIFMLIEMPLRFKLLQSIIAAIYIPRKQLLYTFLLFWIIVYVFSLWVYERKWIEFGTQNYYKLYQFLFRIYDATFKYDSGLGGYFEDHHADGNPYTDTGNKPSSSSLLRLLIGSYGDKATPTEDLLFDSLFNLVVVLIMLDIVSGIIIDTFGALRLEYEERIHDMQNRCFICGIEKEVFDRMSEVRLRYLAHTTIDHNKWNYLWYIAYLADKDETEYTGNESYVAENLRLKEVNWFPIDQSMGLQYQFENIDN